MSTLLEKLSNVQNTISVPKGQRNTFGKYNYRSCEDILNKCKPICKENGLAITISDDIIIVSDRYYVKATVTILELSTGDSIQTTAFARESLDRKGQDDSQITGTASSYARKYALNGLFLLDDTKDADSDEFHKASEKKEEPKQRPNDHDVVPTEDFKAAEKITPAEIKVVEKMLADLKWKVEDVFSKPIADLTKEEYGKALQALRTNLEKLKGSK